MDRELLLEFVRALDVTARFGARPLEDNDYLLRSPEGDGTYVSGAFRWSLDVAEALAGLDNTAALSSHVDALARLLRAFLDQAEWSRIDAMIQRAIAADRGVRLTLRSAAAELYLLPWEFLTVGGRPQCEAPRCLLRYEWPRDAPRSDAPPQAAPPEGGRILVAWSGWVPAAEHISAIRRAAREAQLFFDPDADVIAEATLPAIEAALADERRPVTALHLVCHGAAAFDPATDRLVYGLALQPDVVLPEALRSAIERARSLRLVVLCACDSGNPGALDNKMGSVAQQIHRAGVDAVVASRYSWTIDGSRRFADAFYRDLLVELRSVEDAFGRAQALEASEPGMDHAAMQLYGFSDRGYDTRPIIFRPYRGLRALSASDARFFFGRDAEREALLDRIARGLAEPALRFLLIAGASGSGKSSLAMAGLAADLAAGRLAARASPPLADAGWRVVIVRPTDGASPLAALRDKLGDAGPDARGRRLLVVVDQFEEIFTQARGAAEQEAFVRELYRRATDPSADCFVVGALRMEYLGHFGRIRMEDGAPFDKISLDPAHHFLVRQLTPEQYSQIVRGPCERCGVLIEPGLEERLVAAAGSEPGALPLLAYAMDRLWELREKKAVEGVIGWWLTDDAYSRIGELKGALAARFDEVLAALSDGESVQARRLLVQLVNGADDPAMATRRRRRVAELRPGAQTEREAAEAADFDSAAAALVDGRLCVTGQDDVGGAAWIEIAHEAIVRGVPRLQGWLKEDGDWMRATDELRERAGAWEARLRAETAAEYLLTRRRLADARAAWARYGYHLGAEDRRTIEAFLSASQAEEDRRAREAEEQRQRELRLARRAREFALASGARDLLSQGKAVWASKLLLESHEPEATRGWSDAAKSALSARIPFASLWLGRSGPAIQVLTFTPDGRSIVARSTLYRVQCVLRADGAGEVEEQYHPDGFPDEGDPSRASPDGRLVVEIDGDVAWIKRADGSGEPVALRGHAAPIEDASFSPDGRRVLTASADFTTRIWNVDGSGAPIVLDGHDRNGIWEYPAFRAAFSPDGRVVATSAPDNFVCLWNLDAVVGEPLDIELAEGESVTALAFSRDGRRAVGRLSDGALWVWSVDGSSPHHRYAGPDVTRALGSLGIEQPPTPDGGDPRISIAERTIEVRARAAGEGTRLVQCPRDLSVLIASLSPDGARLAVSYQACRSIDVIDVLGAVEPITLEVPGWWAAGLSWSGDSRRVLVSADRTSQSGPLCVFVWDPGSDSPPTSLPVHDFSVRSAALSADGARVITTIERGVRIWDLSTESLRARLDAANIDCLPPDLRVRYLDESEAEARERYESAMRARGRVPRRD